MIFFGNIAESELYLRFKDLVGNESNIGFCGPAYIDSIGRGLHVGRNIKFVWLQIPTGYSSPLTDALTFPRYMMGLWLYYCSYNDENATTTIYTLEKGLKIDENNSINISGKHIIVCGIFIFRHPNRFRKQILKPIISKLTGIPKNNITFFIEKIHGKIFFNWTGIYLYLSILQFFTPFKLKIPLYGFLIPLEFRGYTPFALRVNKTKI